MTSEGTMKPNRPIKPIEVLIADDHAIVREGLVMFLSEEPEAITVVGQASDGREALEMARRLCPDVILMDLVMPEMNGIEVTRKLAEAGVPSRVLILTSFADDTRIRDALAAGAKGFLLKDVLRSQLLEAICAAHVGKPWLHPEAQQHLIRRVSEPAPPDPFADLTEREMDVLRLIARGRSNKEIAADLFLSVGTVKGHVSAILAKLDCADRTQAALFASQHGLGA